MLLPTLWLPSEGCCCADFQ